LAGADSVAGYELFIDDAAAPVAVVGNLWTVSSLAPGSTHSFKLAYKFSSGERSGLSEAARGTTWGSDEALDGLPDDWQSGYWGSDTDKWPDPKADSDGDGATNLEEFLAGTNPLDAASVLRTSISATPQGSFLHWNAQPGFIYQVQSKAELSLDWADVGAPRFAAGAADSILIERTGDSTYYRVKRLR
jgi:hypothetical protein